MRHAKKSMDQDKGKCVLRTNPDHEATQGFKKGVLVRTIAGGPTLASQFRKAIKKYERSILAAALFSKEVNCAMSEVAQVPHHLILSLSLKRMPRVLYTPIMIP